MNAKIISDFYLFQDLPMYILNAEATVNGRRRYLKRHDMVDVSQRLKIVHPMVEEYKIPDCKIAELPKELADVVEMGAAWKVEWFYCGQYKTDMSLVYAERYRPNEMSSLLGRVADTVGFCTWEKAFALWQESLYRPGIKVFYEGRACWQGSVGDPVVQKAVMISVILDLDHVITVTSVKQIN